MKPQCMTEKNFHFDIIYQTLETVFDHISKHLNARQKYSVVRHIFNSLLGVCKLMVKQSFMFDKLYAALSHGTVINLYNNNNNNNNNLHF